jgi:translation initiation factor 2B subunit (eIF-2B alpha/beta/delta family)
MHPADDLQRLASDVTSSATALLEPVYRLLADARREGPERAALAAAAVCRAQPAMGSVWNLAAAALGDREDALDRLFQRALRAPAAIGRFALDLLGDGAAIRRVVTCSRSAAVEACIGTLHARQPVTVRCAESRPRCEGRALAGALAALGVRVELFTDAAVAEDLGPEDRVIVGADAVSAEWFVNKSGTGALCAAALLAGAPAYVLSGREKLVSADLARALRLREDDPAAVWPDAPAGVAVRNPLFERVPLDRVAGVISDAGLLAGEMIGTACEAVVEPTGAARLRRVVLSS